MILDDLYQIYAYINLWNRQVSIRNSLYQLLYSFNGTSERDEIDIWGKEKTNELWLNIKTIDLSKD